MSKKSETYYTLDPNNKNARYIDDKVLQAFAEYEPRHDTVLALPLIADSKLGSLLVAPEDALREESPAAYVFKVGPGGYNATGNYVEMDPKLVGKVVYYQQHNPKKIKADLEVAYSIGNDHILVEKNSAR